MNLMQELIELVIPPVPARLEALVLAGAVDQNLRIRLDSEGRIVGLVGTRANLDALKADAACRAQGKRPLEKKTPAIEVGFIEQGRGGLVRIVPIARAEDRE